MLTNPKTKYWLSCQCLEGKNRGAEVNIDIGHTSKGTPAAPHVGWQTPGKNNTVGHIFINSVDVNRSRVKLD